MTKPFSLEFVVFGMKNNIYDEFRNIFKNEIQYQCIKKMFMFDMTENTYTL